MTISLCMIVKDEEKNLKRCLESVKHLVDEMIVVDTGSTDSTVSIAESYGAKVYHFAWNGNFSDARNYALRQAAGDYLMIMDADDEMEKLEKSDILKMIEATGADAYFFETISYVGEKPGLDVLKNMNMRLMKNHMGYFFTNAIHEQIYCNIIAANPSAKIVNCDMKVYHYGYLNKSIAENNKRARNIALLEKELEAAPDNSFTVFNLGSEYYAMGDNLTAIGYFEKSYENFNPKEGFSSHLLLKMVVCYIALGRTGDALRIIDFGLVHFPLFTDLMFMKGNAYSTAGKIALALKAFQNCVEMGEAPNYLNVIVGTGTYRPLYLMGNIYFEWEDYESAAECYQKAFLFNTDYMAALYLLIKAWCRLKPEPAALQEKIESLRAHMPPSYDSVVFEQLLQEKYYGLTLSYIGRYEKTNGTTPYSQYFRGLCLLYENDYAGALDMMDQAYAGDDYRLRAICIKVLCYVFDGKFGKANDIILEGRACGDNEAYRVCAALIALLQGEPPDTLSDNEAGSAAYTPFIFEVLKILLLTRQPEAFEKALGLLNTVTDKTVLLRLGKLYYDEGCFGLAYKELMRSVQVFSHLDAEGAKMLYALKRRGF